MMEYSQTLDAIAKGVETRLVRSIITNLVTLETLRIARLLDIPEEEIQEWRSFRCCKSRTENPPGILKSLDKNN